MVFVFYFFCFSLQPELLQPVPMVYKKLSMGEITGEDILFLHGEPFQIP